MSNRSSVSITGQSIVVEYNGTEPTLTLDADVPLLPAPYHFIVATLAASLLLERTTRHVGRGAMAQFAIFRQEYEKWARRQQAMKVRSNGGPFLPRVRPGAPW